MPLEVTAEPIALEMSADGVWRVGGTRVPLDTVVLAFNEGATAEEIVQQYPSLQLADVYSVIGYYLRRRRDVDAYLEERRQQSEQVRKLNDSRFPGRDVRERLLARRSVGGCDSCSS